MIIVSRFFQEIHQDRECFPVVECLQIADVLKENNAGIAFMCYSQYLVEHGASAFVPETFHRAGDRIGLAGKTSAQHIDMAGWMEIADIPFCNVEFRIDLRFIETIGLTGILVDLIGPFDGETCLAESQAYPAYTCE